jgi:hypothetical protein
MALGSVVTKASVAARSTSDTVEHKPAIREPPRLVGKRSPPLQSCILDRRPLAPLPSIADASWAWPWGTAKPDLRTSKRRSRPIALDDVVPLADQRGGFVVGQVKVHTRLGGDPNGRLEAALDDGRNLRFCVYARHATARPAKYFRAPGRPHA